MEAVNNVNFTQANFEDRRATPYLTALGARNLKFSPKLAPATDKNPDETILIHVDGELASENPALAGIIINMDLWPSRNCTEEDKAKILEGDVRDVVMRFGFYHETDALTGAKRVVAGKPKWQSINLNGVPGVTLSGEKREYREF